MLNLFLHKFAYNIPNHAEAAICHFLFRDPNLSASQLLIALQRRSSPIASKLFQNQSGRRTARILQFRKIYFSNSSPPTNISKFFSDRPCRHFLTAAGRPVFLQIWQKLRPFPIFLCYGTKIWEFCKIGIFLKIYASLKQSALVAYLEPKWLRWLIRWLWRGLSTLDWWFAGHTQNDDLLHNALKRIKNLSSHKITNRTTTGKASADRNTKITLALTAPGRNHVVCKIFTTYADCYHDRLATISTNIKPTLELLFIYFFSLNRRVP